MERIITKALTCLNSIILLCPLAVRAQPIERSCPPIARILSAGDKKFPPQAQLCANDSIEPADPRSQGEMILCYLNGRIFLAKGVIGNQCLPVSSSVRKCNADSRGNCLNLKGHEESPMRLITPYGILVLNSRPLISWTDVKATSYTVQVRGNGVNWFANTKVPRLAYPENQPPLEFGNVYKISVIANQNQEIAGSISTILMLPSHSKLETLSSTLRQLQNFGLNDDYLAIDMAEVCLSQSFLDQGIIILEGRAKAGSGNPQLYKMLGDLYSDVGLVESAKLAYRTAILLENTSRKSPLPTTDALSELQSKLK